jgi:M6 family metalloprotease-like protein
VPSTDVAKPRKPAADLAPELAHLAYARAWSGDQPGAFAQFRTWVSRYLAATAADERESLLGEGLPLARARRVAMRTLVEKDPEQALALTVPASVRARLPASITSEMEERISTTADFSVLVFDYGPAELVRRKQAGLPTDIYQRFVSIEGAEVRAYSYGRRTSETTKMGIPIHGVRLDGAIALHPAAIRVLEPDEGIDPARPVIDFDATVASGAGSGGVRAEIGGRVFRFANVEQLLRAEAAYEAAESKIGPQPIPAQGEILLPLPATTASDKGTAPLAPTPWTIGAKNVLVIRVDFSDRAGDPKSSGGGTTYSAAFVQNIADSQVKPFYAQSAYGQTSLNFTVTTQLYRMPQPASTYALAGSNTQLHTDARAAAGANYTVTNYDRVIVLFTYLGTSAIAGSQITYGGLADLGASRVWVNGEFDFRVVSHELGHTYGLNHANLWQVADGSAISATGTNTEYGDDFDTMGANFANSQSTDFNPWFKNLLGWAADSQVQTATATGTYRINRFDNSTGTGTLALKIAKDATRSYWIGVRRNFTSNASMSHGAYVIWGFNSNQQSRLLDLTTPGTSVSDAALAVGQTLVDSAANLSFRVVAEGGTTPNQYLDVQVTLGLVNSAPTIVTQPLNTSVAAGATATLTPFVSGSPAPTFQWRKSGTNITGATLSSLTLANVQTTDAGGYDVVITNALGTVTSNAAQLTVNPAGGAAPSNDNFTGAWILSGYGGVATTTNVGATGETGEPTHLTTSGTASSVWFRWTAPATGSATFDTLGSGPDTVMAIYTGGSLAALAKLGQDDDSAGGTASKLTFSVSAGTTYAVAVGGYSSTDRGSLTLNYLLTAAPTVTAPTSQTLVVGQTATFASTATGTPPLTLRWKKNNVALADGGRIAGAATATLQLSGLVVADAGSYTLTATNGIAPDAVSAAAVLTVAQAGQTLSFGPLAGRSVGDAPFDLSGTASSGLPVTYASSAPAVATVTGATVTIVGAGTTTITASQAGSADYLAAPDVTQILVVANPNTSPTLSPLANLTVLTNTATGARAFTVGDAETPAAALVVTATSSNQTLVPAANLALGGSGANRTLNVTPATGQNGTATITVTVSDGALSATASFNLTVQPAGPAATHLVAGNGYVAGGTVVVTNTLGYTGTLSSLRWTVTLPAGWTFAASAGNDGHTKPTVGATGQIEWIWTTIPASPFAFTYSANVPAGTTGTKNLAAIVTLTPSGTAVQIAAQPDPLTVAQITTHAADTDRDFKLSLLELARVIELFNTRNGTVRTGCYKVDATGEDGFNPEPTRTLTTLATLSFYHTVDENRDGKLDLLELTRMIELFNYRSGPTRTGQYHLQSGTEDGFAPGP